MFNVFWFVLAGFVLGFATSLLWEWLYFRKRRIAWPDSELEQLRQQNHTLQAQLDQRSSSLNSEAFNSGSDRETGLGQGKLDVGPAVAAAGNYQSNAARTGSELPEISAPTKKAAPRSGQAIAVPPAGQRVRNNSGRVPAAPPATASPASSQEIGGFNEASFIAGTGNAVDSTTVDPLPAASVDTSLAANSQLPTARDTQIASADSNRHRAQAAPSVQQPIHSQSTLAGVTTANPQHSPSESLSAQVEQTQVEQTQVEQIGEGGVNRSFIREISPGSNIGEADIATASATVSATAVDNTAVDNTAVDNTAVDNTAVDNTAVDNTVVDHTAVDHTAADYSVEDGYFAPSTAPDSEATPQDALNSPQPYGQHDPNSVPPHSDRAHGQAAQPTDERDDQTPSFEEPSHKTDVDFFNKSRPQGLPTGEHFSEGVADAWSEGERVAKSEVEVPTVTGVMRSSVPDQASPDKSQGPNGTREYESAFTLPAEIATASLTTPIANGATGGVRKAETDYPDDLTKVKGIGPKFQKRLYANGIFTWDQLGKSKPDVVEAAAQPRINEDVSNWIAQAQILAGHHGRTDATYYGPAPDDLSQIDGLNKRYMSHLYQHGIVSYSQLAKEKKSRLKQIFTDIAGADKINFTEWAKAAKALAR